MTCDDVVAKFQGLGDDRLRQQSAKRGVLGNQFGVKMSEVRSLAKKIKTDHPLALALWETRYFEAMLLATLVMKPSELDTKPMTELVRSSVNAQVADWLNSYVLKAHPDKELLRKQWETSTDAFEQRAYWSLTTEKVAKTPDAMNLAQLLDRIEVEMGSAPVLAQWTMNCCLAEIGINHSVYRPRAIAIGEKLGVFRDYPTSKGCTSPFAPIWIAEMVGRQSKS